MNPAVNFEQFFNTTRRDCLVKVGFLEMDVPTNTSTSNAGERGGLEYRIDIWLGEVRREMETAMPSATGEAEEISTSTTCRVSSCACQRSMEAGRDDRTDEGLFTQHAVERTLEWALCCRGKFPMARVAEEMEDALPWVPATIRQAVVNTFERFDYETAKADVWIRGGYGNSASATDDRMKGRCADSEERESF